MTKHSAIELKPILKENVWGGSRLINEFHYVQEGDAAKKSGIGECWGVSAHANGDCVVAQGPYQGMTLSWLYENRRDLFGNLKSPVFPLLVKIIDAADNLSIQVHPGDAYAMEHENGSLGKSECWYVMDAPEGAELIVGHNAKTKEELEDLVHLGRYDELIRKIPVQKGDFVQIAAGTVHAITAGILVLEIQQSCDITYRVYDYGRLVNGKLRPLHIRQSLDVINVPDDSDNRAFTHAKELPENELCQLVSCDKYKVWKVNVSGDFETEQDEPFMILSVVEGEGMLGERSLERGDQVLLPTGYGKICLSGQLECILSAPNEA